MKIVLVDDDAFALKLLSFQLARAGCHDVRTFTGADDALAAVKADATALDLVFCDLQMPGTDGVAFVRQLIAQGYAGALVLVSGEDRRARETVERLAAAHSLRILGTLAKPVLRDELQRMLERAAPPAARTQDTASALPP